MFVPDAKADELQREKGVSDGSGKIMWGSIFKRIFRVGLAVAIGKEAAEIIPVSADVLDITVIAAVAGFGRWLRHRFPHKLWTRILPF